MLQFRCPQCGTGWQDEDLMVGTKVACAVCDARFLVPPNGEEAVLLSASNSKQTAPSPASSDLDASSNKIVISFDDIPSSPPDTAVSTRGTRNLPPRQRRLYADALLMHNYFVNSPYIHVTEASGDPPEKYVVDFHVRGIERVDDGNVIFRNHHKVEIKLSGTYPRTPPTCRMLTPIFHPNIEPAIICIGDHWTAGERLCDLVVRIAEIITYQSYNIKSPLDGEAAMWADLNQELLPIDNRDLMPPEL